VPRVAGLNPISPSSSPLIGTGLDRGSALPGRPALYRGRFAPSPTGPLHAGSLVAALASWLDARVHRGAYLVRIEDLDRPREAAGAAASILATLATFGLDSDEPVVFQHGREELYRAALRRLQESGHAYRCTCSRRAIEEAIRARTGWRAGVYPGTCAASPPPSRSPHAWRVRTADAVISFDDRCAGRFVQHVGREVGDFVVRRTDGLWAYQLAVVVDDAEQRITDVVRGADLLDNTPRQIWLQRLLQVPTPRYLHVPVVKTPAGQKLSKQTGARALDASDVLGELERAWQHLGFQRIGARSRDAFLRQAATLWAERWMRADTMRIG
jgi:glutamyl-Q tRNA(Asp) synthetase